MILTLLRNQLTQTRVKVNFFLHGVDMSDNIINKCIIQGTFPNFLKKAIVSPVYKKKDSFKKENYRPISLLTALSKVFEKAVELQLSQFLEEKFSKFLCAYRKQFSFQHALFRFIEDWKTELERNKHIDAVLMDLSKAFDCLPKNTTIKATGINTWTSTFQYFPK